MKISIEHPLTIIKQMMTQEIYQRFLKSDLFKLASSAAEFTSTEANDVIFLLRTYKSKYSKWPSGYTRELEDLRFESGKVPNTTLSALFEVPLEEYDQEVLNNKVQEIITYSVSLQSVIDVQTQMVKLETAAERNEVMLKAAVEISELTFQKTENLQGNIWDPASYSSDEYVLLPTGYKALDEMLSTDGTYKKGGFLRGGLYSFMAPPKGGKSLMLANCATRVCLLGHNIAIASFEMSKDDYYRRILCHMFEIPSYKYNADEVKITILDLKAEKERGKTKPFGQVFVRQFSPINTPQDVKKWVLDQEKKHGLKIDYVFVDYINLVKNGRSNKADNTYLTVKQVAEDLRGFGMTHGWTTVTATQTNRAASDSTTLTMADVSESFGLPATADGMIGIVKQEDILSCNLLASRRSAFEGVKTFRCHWQYWKISEVSNLNVGTEAFINLTTLPKVNDLF